ncbi:manganese transport protein MntH [Pseudobythopirellula maris]|uniref:Manganese transport protein MntH n=1 Tax=Pseudobythopirellula maris TaxID=2527991 RepID=A0A5C5ZJJ1_9BACT|nr:Nramp family divalent metal transporter [Pseudobythopirellula maris]TWT87197.1 manganese transport protein MntH [Pseudobythopirellula maris]
MPSPHADSAPIDPYKLDPSRVEEPPTTWLGMLSYCGPGFILSASIVGSGELIATTVLGAKAGFATLWVILVSCLVKVAVQLEFGRHTIQTGETCVEAMNRLPGPKPARVHWTIWAWVLLQPIKILQVGGIVGGVAMVLGIVWPGVPLAVWAWGVAGVTALLVCYGRYRFVERTSLVLLAMFSLLTLVSVAALQWTDYAVSWGDVLSGLGGHVPEGAWIIVIGAFGLTGVGGDEIMHYSYWLLEKGYAAKTGPYDPADEAWVARARGWIRVMQLDAMLSMVAYTVVTAAFYCLGAAVLHARGEAPEGYALIETLATMYTESLGPWSRHVFLAGALVVLYSSVFAALAAWCRMYADAFDKLGWVRLHNTTSRRRTIAVLAWAIALSWAAVYLFVQKPVWMVLWGGVATSAILLLAVWAAVDFRTRRALPALRPRPIYRAAFWLSAGLIASLAVWGVTKASIEYFG